jgi:RNA polymerase sigma-70 factor (ECF subfamily)
MKAGSKQIKENETELLLRLQNGDEEAFATLFCVYKDKLYNFLLRVTHSKSTSKDLVQDIFLKLWRDRESLPEINNLNAYLFRMAQNHALNELNRFGQRYLPLSAEFNFKEDIETPTPVDLLISQEVKDKFAEAVGKLPPQQQKIFTLHKEEGISHAEIARQLNLSVSTIQNHMRQALINIRHYLSHAYPGLFMIILITLAFSFSLF